MKLHPLFTACAALLALSSGLATAQTTAVPNFISYQGRVVDAAGANVGTGTPVNRTVIFRIWDSPSSTNTANLIYSEAQTVTVSEGEFSVLVGQGVANPTATFGYSEADRKLADLGTAFNGSARYLGVTVAAAATIALTDNEITPRQQIVSTAFAMRAKFAESIGSSSDLALTPLSGTASNYGLGWYGNGRLFGGTAVDGPVLYGNAGGALGSNASGTRNTALRWDANGRVGIGSATAPAAKLSIGNPIYGDATTLSSSFVTNAGTLGTVANSELLLGNFGFSTNNSSSLAISAYRTAAGTTWADTALILGMNVDVSKRPSGNFISIHANGNVGIGHAAPGFKLSVAGNAYMEGAIHAGSDIYMSSGRRLANADGALYLSTLTAQPTVFQNNGAETMRISATGNVGIGTTAPGAKLEIADGVGNATKLGSLQITRPGTGSPGAHLAFIRNGFHSFGMGYAGESNIFGMGDTTTGATAFSPNFLAINPASGNVGIGIANPIQKLDVNGNAYVRGQINLDSAIVMGNGPSIWGTNTSGVAEQCFWPRSSNGTYINYGTSGFYIRNNASTNTMVMSDSGIVQIGTGWTDARLNVGSINSVVTMIGYLDTHGGQSGDSTVSRAMSIRAEGLVLAGLVGVASDLRIKTDLHPTDSIKDLETLMGIEVTDYHFKDKLANGNTPQKKAVAQQLEKVYPQAVNTTKGMVPDIYQKAEIKDGWVALATDLKVGERVRLISDKEEGIHEVLEVKADRFLTQFKPAGDQVFVYGREVNDFRSVDYDAISMLNVSATQQLKLEKDAEIQALRDENAALRRELAAKDESHEARLIALERLISKDGTTETVSLRTAKVAE